MFDTKRHRTFKALVKLANLRSSKRWDAFNGTVLLDNGHLYASDTFILVRIAYPEFADMGKDGQLELVRFEDLTGKHLEKPEFTVCEKRISAGNKLNDMLNDSDTGGDTVRFNPAYVQTALNFFKINGLDAILHIGENRLFFSGANENVEIHAVVMGLR